MSEQRLEGFAKAKTATPFIASEQESEQRLEGFAKAKTATPFIASEQERHDTM